MASKVPGVGPVGMVIGTFTSVSLDPPLVGFLPGKASSTWPLLREVGRFSINVLDIHHDRVCRDFASRSPNRFDPRLWDTRDMPRLSGAVLWVDCTLESVTDAGDHDFVLARVHDLEVCRWGSPMVFVRGGYGSPHLPHEIRRKAWSGLRESAWLSDPWD